MSNVSHIRLLNASARVCVVGPRVEIVNFDGIKET